MYHVFDGQIGVHRVHDRSEPGFFDNEALVFLAKLFFLDELSGHSHVFHQLFCFGFIVLENLGVIPFFKKEGAYFALVKFSDLEVQEVVITMLALVF